MRSDIIKKGFERAPHRSLLRATGSIESEADWDKPFIAICNSYTDCIPGHAHLNEVGMLVKRLVREAGGVPFIFNTIGVDDGIAMGHCGMLYSLPSRELIADCVETMLKAHCFDGMVCIPNCDKIVPGMLMAAMRVNIPTVFVSGGPMAAGIAEQKATHDDLAQYLQPATGKSDLISVFKGVGELQAGKITEAQLKKLEQTACPTCGSCSGMFTANSMNCLCEALGMALPGNGTILAVSKEREALYERAARAIIQLVEHDLKPRDIATLEAFDNSSCSMSRWAARRTRFCTRSPSRAKRALPTTSSALTTSRAASRACARCRRHRTITCRTCIAPAASTPSSANSNAWACSTRACKTVTGKTLGENIDEWDIRSEKCAHLGEDGAHFRRVGDCRGSERQDGSGRPHRQRQSGAQAHAVFSRRPASHHVLARCRRVECRRRRGATGIA